MDPTVKEELDQLVLVNELRRLKQSTNGMIDQLRELGSPQQAGITRDSYDELIMALIKAQAQISLALDELD